MSEPELNQSDQLQGWNDASQSYARISEPGTVRFARLTWDLLAIQPGDRLIDIAAGTGALACEAARAGADVLAIDSSEAMVAYLRDRAERAGWKNLQTQVMDGQSLNLDENLFDVALSVFGIFLFPDYRQGLAEAVRVTRPGGQVGLTV